jgi:hypothetical protein
MVLLQVLRPVYLTHYINHVIVIWITSPENDILRV